jgi:hypothetical protein
MRSVEITQILKSLEDYETFLREKVDEEVA